MKIELNKNSTIDFSKKVKTRKNTISQENVGKVLAMFTKIYSDEPLAILREYTSNAYDANVQSGTDNPIIVGLYKKDIDTNSYEPDYELVIKDNGLGMTKEFMLEKFTQMTYSTSDTNDDFIGGFGIGSKSGLAYSDTVIYECIADEDDGKRYKSVWLLAKEDGESSTSLLTSNETTEETGVKVSIKVKNQDYHNFYQKAGQLIFFSNIYFDGKLSSYNGIKVEELNNFYLVDNAFSNYYNMVVVGSVLYPSFPDLPTDDFSSIFLGKTIVPKFNVSDLKVVHNRELIRDNEISRKVISDKFKEVEFEIVSYIESLFKDVKTENEFSKLVEDNFGPSSLNEYNDTLIDLFIEKFSLKPYSRHFNQMVKYYVRNNSIHGDFHKRLRYNSSEDKLETTNEWRNSFSRKHEDRNNKILIYDDLDSRSYLKQVRTLYKEHNCNDFLVINKNSLRRNLYVLKFIKDRYFKGEYYKLSEIEKTNKKSSDKEKFSGKISVKNILYQEESYSYYDRDIPIDLEEIVSGNKKYIYFYDGRSNSTKSFDSYKLKLFFKNHFSRHNEMYIKLIAVNSVKNYKLLSDMETENLINVEQFLNSQKIKLDPKYDSGFKYILSWYFITGVIGDSEYLEDYLRNNNFITNYDTNSIYVDLKDNDVLTNKIKEIASTKRGRKTMSEALEFLTMLKGYPKQILFGNDKFSMYIYDKSYRPEVIPVGLKYLYSTPKIRRQRANYKIKRQEIISTVNAQVKKLFKTTN